MSGIGASVYAPVPGDTSVSPGNAGTMKKAAAVGTRDGLNTTEWSSSMYAETRLGRKRESYARSLPLSSRLLANASLLQMMLHSPERRVSKGDLRGLVADLLRQASEAEELEAMAGLDAVA